MAGIRPLEVPRKLRSWNRLRYAIATDIIGLASPRP